jgi:hypothetical protein
MAVTLARERERKSLVGAVVRLAAEGRALRAVMARSVGRGASLNLVARLGTALVLLSVRPMASVKLSGG